MKAKITLKIDLQKSGWTYSQNDIYISKNDVYRGRDCMKSFVNP